MVGGSPLDDSDGFGMTPLDVGSGDCRVTAKWQRLEIRRSTLLKDDSNISSLELYVRMEEMRLSIRNTDRFVR